MVMPAREDMHFRRVDFVKNLVKWGLPQLAERAAQELPEDFDGVQAVAWCNRVGISLDDLLMVSMVAERLCESILMTTAPTPSSTL